MGDWSGSCPRREIVSFRSCRGAVRRDATRDTLYARPCLFSIAIGSIGIKVVKPTITIAFGAISIPRNAVLLTFPMIIFGLLLILLVTKRSFNAN